MAQISVIVPVYNSQEYLLECIESILNQTYKDFELILVDDGSTDQSGIICDEYGNKDGRVKILHKKNGGVSAARNDGMRLACGKYITFVDSDDGIDPDYLQRLSDNDADIVICGVSNYYDDVRQKDHRQAKNAYYSGGDIPFADLYEICNMYSPYNKLYKSGIIKDNGMKFISDLSWGEDALFAAEYMYHSNSVQVIDYYGYRYYHRDNGSLTTKLRTSIISDITRSRTGCLEFVKKRSSDEKKVKEFEDYITEDIRKNCAYFIEKLFYGNMSLSDSAKTLNVFKKNKYVEYTLKNARKYYDKRIERSLRFKSSKIQLIVFRMYSKLGNFKKQRS